MVGPEAVARTAKDVVSAIRTVDPDTPRTLDPFWLAMDEGGTLVPVSADMPDTFPA